MKQFMEILIHLSRIKSKILQMKYQDHNKVFFKPKINFKKFLNYLGYEFKIYKLKILNFIIKIFMNLVY